MTSPDPEPLPDDLLPWLAAYDEQQAGTSGPISAASTSPPSQHLPRLQRLQACIDLLRQGRIHHTPAQDHLLKPNETFGRFRIVRELGRGGFGVVFLADDPALRRHVALKVPRPEVLADPALRQRFLREAQAAANLDHPNLVPVHEVGEVGPVCYIVSTYCPGPTLAAWLPQQPGPLPPRRAAVLVACLAGAIQHAHSHGIVHRDLKPANVLLVPRTEAEQGELDFTPRLTDFGLAKLLDTAPDQSTSGAVGTPLYMAPEQAERRSRDVGPACDIYALGAILYELLTGRPPFLGPTPLDVLRQVSSAEPVPVHRLQPGVPRDLCTICLKCLEKDASRRYGSGGKLADDLGRFLRGEPIQARPVGRMERAWRWGRRHPAQAGLVGAMGLLVAAVVVVLVLGTAAAVYTQQQRQRGREQAETGLIRATELRQGYRFSDAEAMLEQVRGWVKQAADRDLDTRLAHAIADLALARDLDRVRQEAATLVEGKWDPHRVRPLYPAVLARHGLDVLEGDLDELAQKIRASAVRESIVAALDDWAHMEADRSRWQRLLRLANLSDEPDPWRQAVREAVAQGDQRRRRLAAETGEGRPTPGVIQLLSGGFGPQSKELIVLLRRMQLERPRDFWVNFNLGDRLNKQQKHQEAAGYYLVAVALRPDSAPTYNNLGNVWKDQGNVEEAIACFQKALSIDRSFAIAHYNLGNALKDQGKMDEAMACYQRAIACDPEMAMAHNNLGMALARQGKEDEAIACYQRAVACYQRAVALDPRYISDPRYAAAHANLGRALREKGKVEEAIACFHRAIALDPNLVDAHISLGAILCDVKRDYEGAIACFKKAIALDPKNAHAHSNLGTALSNKGKVEEAIACFHTAIALDAENAWAHSGLGSALAHKGKEDEAIGCFKRAIALDPSLAQAHFNLGVALNAKKKVDEAIKCFKRTITLAPRFPGAHFNLGVALKARGKLDEAIASFHRAIALSPRDANAHFNLGLTFHARGKVDEAIESYRNAVALDPTRALIHFSLGNALRIKEKMDEAITSYRNAIALDSRIANAHTNLGVALARKGKTDEAIACLHRAIALNRRDADAHGALGEALMEQGKFIEAQKALDRCLVLLRPGHPLRNYASGLLGRCKQRLDADGKLQAFLAGKGAPADAAAQLQMAALAQQPFNRLYLTAARLYRDAFARGPRLADRHRYNAACAAALAGAGQGKDAAKLNDTDRALWRQHSRDWLRDELARLAKALANANAQARVEIAQELRHWQSDPDLAGVRDRTALDNLPEAESQPWLTLWTDVALLDRATATR
jgi:serine/threonine-protein kinase